MTNYKQLIIPRYSSKAFIQSLKSKMPSSLNLFIRVPKGYNENDVFDAVIRKDICKVIDVIIKKGKSKNIAIVMVDYWYKGTRDIRDTLLRSGSIAISFANGAACLAYEYKPQSKAMAARDVDEFGRDITRKSIPIAPALTPAVAPALNVNAPVFVPMVPAVSDILHPYVTDNRAERSRNYSANNDAAFDFIQEYEETFATPEKTQVRQFTAYEILANVRDDIDIYCPEDMPINEDEPGFIPDNIYYETILQTPALSQKPEAVAPGAPEKKVKEVDCSLAEIIRNLENTFIDQQPEADVEAVSDITDADFEEEPRKPRRVEMDFDLPKEPAPIVEYTIPAVKKRNIKFVKPKSKYT